MSVDHEKILHKLIYQLDSPYGEERSIKFIQSLALADRLLLSVHKNAFGESPERNLLHILNELGFPERYYNSIISGLASADIVHFGYENSGQGHFYKCYLEFAEEYLEAQMLENPDRKLVHYAVKWEPENPANPRISYYHSRPSSDPAAIKQYLSEVYSCKRMSVAYEMLLDILSMGEVTTIQDDMMLMSVTEQDNKRHSFDINLYNTELQLADISGQLMKITEYFDINTKAWARLYAGNSSKDLGHLSGGLDGNGREFFTVYFGVEERRMDLVL